MVHTARSNTRHLILSVLLIFTIWGEAIGICEAEAETNITATTGDLNLGTIVSPDGVSPNGTTTIITGGHREGTNLFHSFGKFNLGTNAIAEFQSQGPTIFDIFARVTGGNMSEIDGTIRTSGLAFQQTVNLWFMSPGGILFGPNASLNIPGSAIFTTADTLTIGGKGFSTEFTTKSQLDGFTANNVTDFGFIGNGAKPITIDRSTLEVPSGKTLTFVGGDINITGGNLRAPNGQILITSVEGLDCEVCGRVIRESDSSSGLITHRYDQGNGDTTFPTNPGVIRVGQGIGGKDVIIETDSTVESQRIQLNTGNYEGSTATGSNALSSNPPLIVIQNGSFLVANLPSTKLIVSSPVVTELSPATTVGVGSTGTLTAKLNYPFTSSFDIQVRSNDPTVATLTTQTVTVPAGQNTTPVQFQGIAPGNTSIRADINNSFKEAAITVNLPFDSTLAPTPLTLVEGKSGTLKVTLTTSSTTPITVTFTSSNPAVLTPQASVTIPAGQTEVTVPYTTQQFGNATVTASLQAGTQVLDTAESKLITVNQLQLVTLTPNQPSIEEGKSGTLTLTLSDKAPRDITVTFESSSPGDVPKPQQITIAKGQSTATVPVQGLDDGQALITATYVNDTAAATVLVNLPFDSALAPTPLTLVEGNGGTLKLTLTTASTTPITVTFTSSNPAVLTPQASVTIPAGQTEATVPYTTQQFGDATVTAKLQSGSTVLDTATSSKITVDSIQLLTLTPNQPSLEEGASGTLTLTLSGKAPRDITVTLTNSSPADVGAPKQITVAKGQSTATVPVSGVDDGQALITASYANDTAAATVLVNLPFDSTLAPTPLTLVEGKSGTLKVTLTTASKDPITVTFTSSNPAVLTPQATVTIPANQTEVTVPYTTQQFGDATVTAKLQSGSTVLDTATSSKITVNSIQLVTLTPNQPSIEEGKSGTLTLTLSDKAPRDITVTLTNSSPADVGAPKQITVAKGQSTATVPVSGVDDGQALITASYANDTAAATVLVNLPFDSTLAPTPLTLVEGNGGTLKLTLTTSSPTPITVTFTSSNPAVLTPQATVTIPANQTEVTVPYTTQQFGDATVTAKLQSGSTVLDTATSSKITVNSLQLLTLSPNLTLKEGTNSTLMLTLSNPAPRPITVSFKSSNPADVPAPASITIQPGQTTIPVPIQGADDGQAIITASYAGDTAAATVLVDAVLPPLDSGLLPTPTTLVEGTKGTLTVTLNQPAPQTITVTFTSSDPAVLPAPTSVTIPAGQATVNASYATLQSGFATVTASLRAGTQVLDTATSGKITVNPLQLVTLSPNLTLKEGANGTLTLTLSNPAPRPITVSFKSSNPADVPAPMPITVQPGQTTVTIPVQGIDDGQALITAAYAGDTAAATVLVDPSVLPPPPPTPTPQPQPRASLASAGGQSATNLAVTTRTLKDPPAMQPLPIPPANQLVIASGRCAAGAKGEFSSFVQRGRDASPATPGGPLASPPILDHDVPRISGISVQPGRVALQAPDALQLAPGVSPFLARNAGC